MKKALVTLAVCALATSAFAQAAPELNDHGNAHKFMVRGYARPGGGGSSNLLYHSGGRILQNAKVVCIFWGSSFGSASAPSAYASSVISFRNQFGGTGEYNVIAQYSGIDDVTGATVNISAGAGYSLVSSQADFFDSSNPSSTNVTDAMVQAEVKKYVAANGTNYNTIYEVFIPNGYFSSDGSQGSCGATGGVTLAYCAYHSHYVDGSGKNVKYSIEPYPSCSGCVSSTSWSDAQNQMHFVAHETREAVTDPLGNAWFDRQGNEADDKCAWSPAPFLDGVYGYQYEWANNVSGCVQKQ
jgi:hypothetical protein